MKPRLRPPPPCPDHKGRHQAGCKPCQARGAWKERYHRRERAAGRPLTYPVEQVRDHIDRLIGSGMSRKQIADRSGIGLSSLGLIQYRNSLRVGGDNARAIFGVQPLARPVVRARSRHQTDATGTRRRIYALARMGWPFTELARRIGAGGRRLEDLTYRRFIHAATAERIKVVYDELWDQPGPSKCCATRAAGKGWLPPAAWDDETIDDPNATPAPDRPQSAESVQVDELAVRQAIEGRLTYERLPRPELFETVQRMTGAGLNAREIAVALHWPGADIRKTGAGRGVTRGSDAVCQLRKRAAPTRRHTRAA